MSERIENLAKAGLDSEECPMMDCWGHLTFIASEQFFKCNLCGEVFPLNETLKQWNRTNKELNALIDLWIAEEKAEALERLEWTDEELLEDAQSDRDGFWLEGV